MKRTPGSLLLCFVLAGCPALAEAPRAPEGGKLVTFPVTQAVTQHATRAVTGKVTFAS